MATRRVKQRLHDVAQRVEVGDGDDAHEDGDGDEKAEDDELGGGSQVHLGDVAVVVVVLVVREQYGEDDTDDEGDQEEDVEYNVR